MSGRLVSGWTAPSEAPATRKACLGQRSVLATVSDLANVGLPNRLHPTAACEVSGRG